MRSNLTRIATAATILALAFAGAACDRSARWCELDSTDETVANSYCEQEIDGYEWEPDHDNSKAKKPKPTTKKKAQR